jgi:hypothetical protein
MITWKGFDSSMKRLRVLFSSKKELSITSQTSDEQNLKRRLLGQETFCLFPLSFFQFMFLG